MNVVDRLATVALFSGLSRSDLERLCRDAREIDIARGTKLFVEGDPGGEAYVITSGEIEIIKQSVGRDVLLTVRREGDVIGEMSLLEDAPRMATARARTDATAIALSRDSLDELLDTSQTAMRALFQVLLARRRENEGRLLQSEKMAQLGTLTAGLAHEINNPASAVQRAATSLDAAVAAYATARAAVGRDVPETIAPLLARVSDPRARPHLDPLSRSDAEAELESWLGERGVADPWLAAPALVGAGIDRAALASVDGVDLSAAIELLVTSGTAHELLFQIVEGSKRVFEIVSALKSYSFLDRAPVQEVDIERGIADTLLIMRTKIGDLRVTQEFGGVPPISAYGSELNQVWTNLIDNAVDAIRDGGGSTITIRTRVEGETVIVEIEDDGPGIPPEVVHRIFDSFFTTKAPGKGTGLGLDISYGIVVNRHGGDITVDTVPGRTTFRVILPLKGPPS
ncbi:MAG: cyclic nucleotide-binding domain-containing protein [Acidimicrobiia bacterium]|nr:cyclic nucleotide-binding domain-containing protein [Acidimicrobiia bacterium]